jgi:hypothetical protein
MNQPAEATNSQPFSTADEVWFWTMAELLARKEGRMHRHATTRPCEPDDIVRLLDRLVHRRRIDLAHVRLLRIWGERQCAPNPVLAIERGDWRLWRETLDRLEWPLRVKGIVADRAPTRAVAPGIEKVMR